MAASSEARNWIYDREPGSIFWVTDVPGEPALRNQVCSRLTKGDEPYLERVSQGLYYKYEFAGDPGIRTSRRVNEALCEIAGPGGGPHRSYAPYLLTWANQLPNGYYYSTQRSSLPVTPTISHVRWTHVDLPHRRHLTPNEVALIEATRNWVRSDSTTWNAALESIYHQEAFFRIPKRYEIRSDEIAKAIPHERPIDLEARFDAAPYARTKPPLDERLNDVLNTLRAAGL